jgi:maltose alpha-D-glucosyltransferase/alpha-amylase
MGAIRNEQPQAIVARLRPPSSDRDTLLYDAMINKDFCTSLLHNIGRKRRFKGKSGEITTSSTRTLLNILGSEKDHLEPTSVKAEQTNSSVIYGEHLILKLFRQVCDGTNPELEVGRFLTEKANFAHTSPLVGALEYYRPKEQPMSLAVLQGFVSNEGNAWHHTLDSLERYFQYVLAHPTSEPLPIPQNHLLSLPLEPSDLAKELIGPYLISAQLLGSRTAELHLALASVPDDPNFAPEPFSFMYQTSLYQSLRSFTVRIFQLLQEKLTDLPEEVESSARQVLGLEKSIIERHRLITKGKIAAMRIRCHGDYHLGQVLYTGKDFVIIDFEGEPARSLSERRLKRSPLLDVAGMIRSFHYAAHNAVLHQIPLMPSPEEDISLLQHWSRYWYTWVSIVFLTSYFDIVQKGQLLPDNQEQIKVLLEAFILEKAIYEIGYELNNRPDWVMVPVQGILEMMDAGI